MSTHLNLVSGAQGQWESLRQIPTLRNYLEQLSTEQVQNFRELYSLYYMSLSQNAPFEYAETSQYDRLERQICVKARRLIRKREKIAHLVAVAAPLTREDVCRLESQGNDFSLIETYSNSTHRTHLLLGPTQYVNSDCKPNARLTSNGLCRVGIEALRQIHPGEEICVYYGRQYFDPFKDPCCCKTCDGRKTS